MLIFKRFVAFTIESSIALLSAVCLYVFVFEPVYVWIELFVTFLILSVYNLICFYLFDATIMQKMLKIKVIWEQKTFFNVLGRSIARSIFFIPIPYIQMLVLTNFFMIGGKRSLADWVSNSNIRNV